MKQRGSTGKLYGVAIVLAAAPMIFAQKGGQAGATAGATAGTTNRPPSNPVPDNSGSRRPIFLSGKVVLNDGSPPPQPAKLERVCNGAPHLEGYSDHKGNFSFQLGGETVMQDASMSSASEGLGANPFPGARSNTNTNFGGDRAAGISERQLYGCELRAELSGFRSDSIQLGSRHYLDSPDVGIIVLHRLGNVAGLTISATSALAPKDARKSYEKGLSEVAKNKPDEAKADFEKAVAVYPKHAAAWFELGKLNEDRDQAEEAHKAYDQSLTADSKFIPPLDRLAWMALKETKWERLDELTNRLLSLDPLNYPNSYYLSAVANVQLKHFDLAEKNAREAIRLDPAKKNLRSHYVLGLALASNGRFAESAEAIRTFLNLMPNVPDAVAIRQQLAQIEGYEKAKAEPSSANAEAETKSEADKSKQ